ncbi:MAG: DUF1858 domain-containing protein [Candidatus Nanoarchaeia archaeon]
MEKKRKFVTKEMFLIDIIARYPEVALVLMGYGLHCVGCSFSGADTLEMGARVHGMDDDTINMMLDDVNAVIEKFCIRDTKNNELILEKKKLDD